LCYRTKCTVSKSLVQPLTFPVLNVADDHVSTLKLKGFVRLLQQYLFKVNSSAGAMANSRFRIPIAGVKIHEKQTNAAAS